MDFKLFQMDVKNDFLNGYIIKEVYNSQPPGLKITSILTMFLNSKELCMVSNKRVGLSMSD